MARKKPTTRSKNSRTTRSRGTKTRSRTTNKRTKRRTSRRSNWSDAFHNIGKRLWLKLLAIGFTLAILFLLLLAWFAHDLPSVNKLQAFEKSPGIQVYDRENTLIASYGQVVGEYISFKDIPSSLIAAVVATEDRRFFDHFGVDIWGLLRAIIANVRAGRIVQGGSTITQQLAKNVFLTPDKNLKRKFQELLLSLWLENHFSKQEILEMYLNRVYLGAGTYGIDAAARHYFDKSARKLNLQESALLAGLLKAPSRYAPTRDTELSLNRTRQVLLNMQDAEIIKDKAAAIAISEMPKTLQFRENTNGSNQYFSDWAADRVPDYLGRIQGDIKVYTTLDSTLQKAATEKLVGIMSQYSAEKQARQAALVSMEPNGAIRALIGGKNYHESQYNRATQAMRQPGSAFKLFVYLAAIEHGYTPNSWVNDQPVTFGKWSPKNYTHEYRGEIPLREAFFRSVNTVAAQLAQEVGVNKVISMAQRLGITTKMKGDLSISLGTSEVNLVQLTTAYAHLAATGRQVLPYAITRVENNNGDILYQRTPSPKGQILSQNVARMMNDLLTDTVERGTASRARIGRPAAGKTGTSQDFRDAWFIGFTPELVTGVWVGNDNNKPTKGVTGGNLPAMIWKDYMQIAHEGLPVRNIPQMFRYSKNNRRISGSSDNTRNLPWRKEEPRRRSNPLRSIFDWFDGR